MDRPIYSVQYHPEASPGPHDADYLFKQFVDDMEKTTLMPRREDLKTNSRHRRRPDRHRAGVRVRLLGHAGVQGAAVRRARRHPHQQQSGDHHDGPGDGRPHLHRAAHRRSRHEGHRKGAPRRDSADRRRTDRAQPCRRAARRRRARSVRREADRRERRRHQARRRSPAVPRRDERDRRRHARQRPCAIDRRSDSHRQDDGISGHHPAVVHDGRRRRRHRLQHRRVPRARRARPRDEPGPRAPHRRVGHRLERVRARGDARRRRQLRRHLLDREHRSDGRAHRRQHHRRAGADADRQGISAHARRRAAHHQQGRRRDRRIEHPVLREPEGRPHAGHRDEPARVAVIRAGVEGHGVPDREDRRQARARLSPRRDSQRHHAAHPRVVRADDRLHRDEDSAVELREVPAGRSHADDADEVGGRGDVDRAHVQGVVSQGRAIARARQGGPAADAAGRRRRRRGAAEEAGRAERPAHVGAVQGARARLDRRAAARADAHRSVVPPAVQPDFRAAAHRRHAGVPRAVGRFPANAEARRVRRSRDCRHLRRARSDDSRAAHRRRARARVQAHRHVRGRVRVVHALHVQHVRAGRRVEPDEQIEGRHSRERPEPDRAGARVRLLLLSRGVRAARRGVRDGHDQLQPGNRVDRLRHDRSVVFRAADVRRRHVGDRARGDRRRRRRVPRAVRRPDAAEAVARAAGRRREDSRHVARTRSTSPKIAAGSRSCCGISAFRSRRAAPPRRATKRARRRRRSGSRSSCGRRTCSAGGGWRSCTTWARSIAT